MANTSKHLFGGLYRLDFYALLMCMALGGIIIGNPFFGAAVYLFADIVKAYFLCNLSSLMFRTERRYVKDMLTALMFAGGLSVMFLYPSYMDAPQANIVSMFALCVVLRDYFCSRSIRAVTATGRKNRLIAGVYLAAQQIFFDAICLFLIYGRMSVREFWPVCLMLVVTGLFKLVAPEKRIPAGFNLKESKYERIASYRLFSDMNLYSTISMNLGVLVFMLVMMQRMTVPFDLKGYSSILLWLLLLNLVMVLLALNLKHRLRGLGLAEFIVGAVTWCLGDIMMFRAGTEVYSLLWTFVWGLGMALISSAIRTFYLDFEAVGRVAGEEYDRHELHISNLMVATAASMISSAVMLILMAMYSFILPYYGQDDMPHVLNMWVIQLPVVAMIVAIVFAFRQPLDYRNREKLFQYLDNNIKGREETKENLKNLFVKKYRMRFGVKILCTLARPFLRLKVSGRENLRKENYPSVFVCNHGLIYGPVSAVIYLPTYFRPWIHNVMLDPELARREILKSPLRFFRKIFGERVGNRIITGFTKPLLWILHSFNPIPVVRGTSRDVISTFNASLQALQEGDNMLLFPERARSSSGSVSDEISGAADLRNFYTGFVHIGKMYYDATGKELLFYPIYSDKKSRAFRIGEPVAYDSSLNPKAAKKILAEELQRRVGELSGKTVPLSEGSDKESPDQKA